METKTEIQIVKINPAEYGVEESKASQIAEQFKPMLDKMVELQDEYNNVISMDIDDVMTPLKAKELRLKYVKVRTGTASIHKTQKEFYLQAGRFVDGWKNAQLFASQGIEEKLQAIENHYENKEKERIASIQAERVASLAIYEFNGSSMDLGRMEDTVWINFLSGTKLSFEARKAEEKRIELEKIEAENAAIRERARIAEENAKLKAEAEAKEKQLQEERVKAEAERKEIEAKAKKELEAKEALRLAEQKKADELLEAQRKQAEEKAKKEKAITDAKLKQEREAKEKLEAELKAKRDAEAKAEAEKQAEIKAKALAEAKAAKAPKKEKMILWINELTIVSPAGLDNDKDVQLIVSKFESFKQWALSQIETI